jgi:hypothetical protein
MLGLVLGGILVAAAGPAPAFAVDAGSYLVSAICLTLIGRAIARQTRPRPGETAPMEQAASEGAGAGSPATTAGGSESAAGSVWTLLRRERFLQVVLVVSVTANFALIGTTEVRCPRSRTRGSARTGSPRCSSASR